MADGVDMDIAAEIAGAELAEKIGSMSGAELAEWWAKNYMKAGHKRLGRVLVELHKSLSKAV